MNCHFLSALKENGIWFLKDCHSTTIFPLEQKFQVLCHSLKSWLIEKWVKKLNVSLFSTFNLLRFHKNLNWNAHKCSSTIYKNLEIELHDKLTRFHSFFAVNVHLFSHSNHRKPLFVTSSFSGFWLVEKLFMIHTNGCDKELWLAKVKSKSAILRQCLIFYIFKFW